MGDSDLRLNKGQTLAVITDTAGLLEVTSTWAPAGDPPPSHFHPSQDEEFRVLEGTLIVELDGEAPRAYGPGEMVAVPRRVSHRMWNAGEVPAKATWRITPALGTREMFEAISAKPGPIGMLGLLVRFRREFRLSRLRRP